MHRLIIFCLLITLVIFYSRIIGRSEEKELTPEVTEKRDPFIPLIDDKGNLRRDFQRPIDEQMMPQVALMGISKINKVFYAIIDGEWLKEGDRLKDLRIEKIDSDKVILEFRNRKFEIRLNPEKK